MAKKKKTPKTDVKYEVELDNNNNLEVELDNEEGGGHAAMRRADAEENDEFYTRYKDIQSEINAYVEYDENVFRDKTVLLPCDDPEWSNFTKFFAQNFERFGLKKLISTSYAIESKNVNWNWEPTLFETENPQYDIIKTKCKGKIFTLERDANTNHQLNIKDLKWRYLAGDGDFRSDEVRALRDESDIIITNPPFSLFRDFLKWITEADKKFLILGNPNLLTKRDVFPLIAQNKVWIGAKPMSKEIYFDIPEEYKVRLLRDSKEGSGYVIEDGVVLGRTLTTWYTNLVHGRRNKPSELLSWNDNMIYSRTIRRNGYQFLSNYKALYIKNCNTIPKDYAGVIAVPLTFLGEYCPEQFEIIGRTGDIDWARNHCDFFQPPTDEDARRYRAHNKTWRVQNAYIIQRDGFPKTMYDRIFIRYTQSWIDSHPNDFINQSNIEEGRER